MLPNTLFGKKIPYFVPDRIICVLPNQQILVDSISPVMNVYDEMNNWTIP